MNPTNRQVLPSGLWVVATPIGNLSDMTPRAQMALERADLILCEDTRRTSALLSALGVLHFSKKLERLDAHTQPKQIQNWVEILKTGKSFALVTDAGTPAVSDPGAQLVAQARASGISVTPFPGASAVLALLSASGFQETSFTFRGFFPRKAKEQKEVLQQASISTLSRVFLWFESPLRIQESLQVLAENFPEASVVVGKELTKLHEKIFGGLSLPVAEFVQEELKREGEVGEWCFAVEFPSVSEKEEISGEKENWIKALRCLMDAGVSSSESAKSVSHHFGIPKKEAYAEALRVSGKK